MKKITVLFFLTAALALFAGCGGVRETQGLVQDGETLETDVIPDSAEEGEISVQELKKEIERHIALGEYGKAVSLAEKNIETVNSNSKMFENALDDILIHFSDIAKRYYKDTATYVTKQEIMGYSFKTGFEGFDPESCTIDPHVLEEQLSSDDKVALERVRIEVSDPDSDNYDFKVTVDICGMTAVYPSEDERLK